MERPQPQAHSNTSEAAACQMAKSMAAELGTRGVRVNAIAPGLIVTAMMQAGMSKPEWLDIGNANTPVGRLGRPDLAHTLLLLASDAWSVIASSVTLGSVVHQRSPLQDAWLLRDEGM